MNDEEMIYAALKDWSITARLYWALRVAAPLKDATEAGDEVALAKAVASACNAGRTGQCISTLQEMTALEAWILGMA